MTTMMRPKLRVSISKVCRLGLIKDGKMGASVQRAERIKKCLALVGKIKGEDMKKIIKGFKGFNQDWTCNGFKYVPGKSYKHDGEVKACYSGFHFCENPLDVFNYYSPSTSRFATVEGSGKTSREEKGDSKVSAEKIKIGAEVSLSAYIDMAVKFVFEKAKKTSLTETKNEKEIASNSGNWGAASNSGNCGAASNSGYKGAASNSGNCGAASNSGKEGCAVAMGIYGKAKSCLGGWISICEWAEDNKGEWHRVDMKTTKVDGEKIKPDTWYTLKNGEFVEVK